MTSPTQQFVSPKKTFSSPSYESIVALIKLINSTPRSLKQGCPSDKTTRPQRNVQAREEAVCDSCAESEATDYTVEQSQLAENEMSSVQVTPFDPTFTPHKVASTPRLASAVQFSPRGSAQTPLGTMSASPFFGNISITSESEPVAEISASVPNSIAPIQSRSQRNSRNLTVNTQLALQSQTTFVEQEATEADPLSSPLLPISRPVKPSKQPCQRKRTTKPGSLLRRSHRALKGKTLIVRVANDLMDNLSESARLQKILSCQNTHQ